MKEEYLSQQDWNLILESLTYSKLKFEEYEKYPSPEFKQKRIEEVTKLIAKIKSLRKG
jgi:hypothetical protein